MYSFHHAWEKVRILCKEWGIASNLCTTCRPKASAVNVTL